MMPYIGPWGRQNRPASSLLSLSACRLIFHARILDQGLWIMRHWSIAYKVRLRESSLFGHSTEIGTSSNHLRNPSEFLLHYWESYKRFVAIHVLSLITSDRSSLPRPGLIWRCRPEDVILVPETLGKLRFQLLWASGISAWPSKTRRKRMYRGGTTPELSRRSACLMLGIAFCTHQVGWGGVRRNLVSAIQTLRILLH